MSRLFFSSTTRQRTFGFGKTKELDPFLLLDEFRADHPDDYLAGFA
jgi:quercetin 2,3-dioxygenase